jgi:hypothetical protein
MMRLPDFGRDSCSLAMTGKQGGERAALPCSAVVRAGTEAVWYAGKKFPLSEGGYTYSALPVKFGFRPDEWTLLPYFPGGVISQGTTVPEPNTLALMGTAVAGLPGLGQRIKFSRVIM